MGSEQDELRNSTALPGVQQVVESPVKGLAPHRPATGLATFVVRVNSIVDCRRQQHSKPGREVFSKPLSNYCVDAHRKVGTMRLAGANWNDQSRVAAEGKRNLMGQHVLQAQWSSATNREGRSHRSQA